MQYLAEVKKSGSMLGGAKVEVRLLAKNTSENNWQAINNEDILPVSDPKQAQDLKDGQLVLADVVGNNKQVQSLQDASKRIVLILQNFSRLQDKFKQGEEDIEQWKQSLNYQSQELHRREMELEQKEQEYEQIEARRQEVEISQEELRRSREEFEKLSQAFEADRARLSSQATALDEQQAKHLQDISQRISACVFNPDSLKQQVNSSLEIINQRQEVLSKFWQELDAQRQQAQQQQGAFAQAQQELTNRKSHWQQTQITLADAQAELKAQRGILKVQENNASMIRVQLEAQDDLYHQTVQVIEGYGGSTEVLDPEEVSRLEKMPIGQLEEVIASLQSEFDKMANYVSAQEDELAALEGEIADLKSQIDKASEFDRIELENNKEFAEEQYRMLEGALSGQRENVRQRQTTLSQQRAILDRRQGLEVPENPVQSLIPILTQIESQKQQQTKELQKIEGQIEVVRGIVQQQQELVSRQTTEHQQHYQEIQAMEAKVQERIRVAAELAGQVYTQEQILQPVQDVMDALRSHLEVAANQINQGVSGQEQQKIIAELQQVVNSLMQG